MMSSMSRATSLKEQGLVDFSCPTKDVASRDGGSKVRGSIGIPLARMDEGLGFKGVSQTGGISIKLTSHRGMEDCIDSSFVFLQSNELHGCSGDFDAVLYDFSLSPHRPTIHGCD